MDSKGPDDTMDAQDDLNLRILRRFVGTSFDAALFTMDYISNPQNWDLYYSATAFIFHKYVIKYLKVTIFYFYLFFPVTYCFLFLLLLLLFLFVCLFVFCLFFFDCFFFFFLLLFFFFFFFFCFFFFFVVVVVFINLFIFRSIFISITQYLNA